MTQAYQGTIKPYPNFDPQEDSEVLKTAMKGPGTDEKALINVLTRRTNDQRLKITSTYKQMYGEDLVQNLKSELSGHFRDTIVGLMFPPYDFLASEVNKAVSGAGTNEEALIEILCTRTNEEICGIKKAYTRIFGRSMEADVKDDTSGDFKKLLVSACNGARSETPADEQLAKRSALALFKAGAEQFGTDEEIFNSIFMKESFDQLALTFKEYENLAKQPIEKAIEAEMSGDLKKGLLTIG